MTEPTAKRIVGVDIGGANLKYADVDRYASSRSFPMWRQPNQLASVLADDLRRIRGIDALAVTMTGELADCFADRSVGVDHIVNHTCQAAEQLDIQMVAFYGVDGRFRDAVQARQDVDCVAAANWHALASFVAKQVASDATLIDVGSTTTDIIPIADGCVATAAMTDFDRLGERSLIYVGCQRTPVCALVDQLQFRGQMRDVMNEVFATIDDARLVLGTVPEDSQDRDSADGQPRTRCCAANRLARMIGLDRRLISPADAQELARDVLRSARQRIGRRLQELPSTSVIVVSGHGEDLLDLSAGVITLRLSDQLGAATARCAPSHAVASLFRSEMIAAAN